jgi:hypothetical protein
VISFGQNSHKQLGATAAGGEGGPPVSHGLSVALAISCKDGFIPELFCDIPMLACITARVTYTLSLGISVQRLLSANHG